MSSEIQQNLTSANEKYASNFQQGDLALPPVKKYLVGTFDQIQSPL
jgi:carbonic anhydrase